MQSKKNFVKPPIPKGPKPKQQSDDTWINDTASYISCDPELSFERRPSFKEPVRSLIDTSKRTLKTLHHTLYLMKPRMLKTKLLEDMNEKHKEINHLRVTLVHLKDGVNKALITVRNCRKVVHKMMTKYSEELSELQSCKKDLKYHFAKYEKEVNKLASIKRPINLINTALKIVDKIPAGVIQEMQDV